MKLFLYMISTFYIFILLFGVSLDTRHILKTKLVTQGSMDAATLAGANQNYEVITKWDSSGAPIEKKWYLDTDSTPEQAAESTWARNAAAWKGFIDPNATPTFFRSADQQTMYGDVSQTVQETFLSRFLNFIFGSGSAPNSNIIVPVNSSSTLP